MPSLVRFLILLACLPLLQPPGLCACRVGVWSHPARAGGTVTTAGAACCSHGHCDDDTDDAPPGRPDGCPRPAPGDDHAPGCPASAGVDRFKWVEPVEPLAHVPPPVEVFAFPCDSGEAPMRPLAVTSANRPSSPPIYLSHCALVI